jgi:4-hydroxyacetophenone monooxygenase
MLAIFFTRVSHFVYSSGLQEWAGCGGQTPIRTLDATFRLIFIRSPFDQMRTGPNTTPRSVQGTLCRGITDFFQIFSTQKAKEIAEYMQECADHFDIMDNVELQAEVTDCEWVEARSVWQVTVRSLTSVRVVEADVVVSAVGQLSNPLIPPIPGKEDFAGQAHHTAEWGDLDVKGKRVAVVGTGASSMQLLRNTAMEASEVVVFQELPSWSGPAQLYHKRVEIPMQWRLANIPLFQTYYRLRQYWAMSDGNYQALMAGSDRNEYMKTVLTKHIQRQCGNDKELLAKVLPTYVIAAQ